MPVKQKDEAEAATPAPATEQTAAPAEGTPATEKKEKPVRPDGPFETRTGAKAMTVKGRSFTAGGAKGDAIAKLLLSENPPSRKEIAAKVGSSVSRVAEVAKVLGLENKQQPPAQPQEAAAS